MLSNDPLAQLVHEGFAALSDGHPEVAEAIARQLVAAGEPGGYELLAQSLVNRGHRPQAIAALQEGVASAPDSWALWQMLGHDLSDDGLYAEAREAFQSALRCPGADEASIQMGIAAAWLSEGQHLRALELAESNRDPEWADVALALRCEAGMGLGQFEQVVEATRGLLARIAMEVPSNPRSQGALAGALVLRAKALLHLNPRSTEIPACAHLALELGEDPDDAFELLRALRGVTNDTSRRLKMMVQGILADGTPFWRRYDVVAASARDALAMVSELEPEDTRMALQIVRCEEAGSGATMAQGVYGRSEYLNPPREP